MTIINFPNSPTDGQEYEHQGRKWRYNATKNAWDIVPVTTADAVAAMNAAIEAKEARDEAVAAAQSAQEAADIVLGEVFDDESVSNTRGWTSDKISSEIAAKADAEHTHSASDITSGLAAVATSGSYNDLSDKPSFGTAASANVTTSNVDTTSGRVLKVGDFGLGLDQDSFTFGSGSLNNLTIPGLHTVGAVSGKPDGAIQELAGSCLVIRTGANGRLWQQYVETGGSGANRVWTRTRMNGGDWTPWQEFFHTGNFNPADKADVTGNVASATKLETARTINGTSFDGTANITTSVWGTSRTITIGATGKSVNGSGNVSWSLSEIGAKAADWQPTTASKAQVLNGTSNAFVSGEAYHNVISWANLGNVSSGTLAINLDNSLNFRVNVGGNITVGNPTNADPGKCGEIVITMTANGVVSWQSNWKFLNSVPDIGDNGDVWVISYKVLDSSNVIASASKVAT